MAKRKVCPGCKRDTWSEKNQQCSSCGAGWRKPLMPRVPGGDSIANDAAEALRVAKRAEDRADEAGDRRKAKRAMRQMLKQAEFVYNQASRNAGYFRRRMTPSPGETCPTCQRKVPYKDATQRQRAHRKRKKAK